MRQAGYFIRILIFTLLLNAMKSHWLRTDLCGINTEEGQKVQHRIHPRDGGGGQEDDGVRCGVGV